MHRLWVYDMKEMEAKSSENVCPVSGKIVWKHVCGESGEVSRYKTEFNELSVIGAGGYGCVYECSNKLDGQIYAIKKISLQGTGMDFDHVVSSLSEMLSDGALEEKKIWKIFKDVVLGLNHIHRKGVRHGDLSPNNIFFDEDGIAKIGDFGLGVFRPDSPRAMDFFYSAPSSRRANITSYLTFIAWA